MNLMKTFSNSLHNENLESNHLAGTLSYDPEKDLN